MRRTENAFWEINDRRGAPPPKAQIGIVSDGEKSVHRAFRLFGLKCTPLLRYCSGDGSGERWSCGSYPRGIRQPMLQGRMNTPVVITGINGFCGYHLACHLAASGWDNLIGLDVQSAPAPELRLMSYRAVDLRDRRAVERIIKRLRPSIVFHLAGIMRGSAADVHDVNALGGMHLLESLRAHAPEARVLVVGSAAEYGPAGIAEMPLTEQHPCHPVGAYGQSKLALTRMALDFVRREGMRIVVARPFNIIGPRMPSTLVVGAVVERLRRVLHDRTPPEIAVGNLDTQRDFIAVEEVVAAYAKLVTGEHWGDVFNICSGAACSIRQVVGILCAMAPRPVRLRVDPALVRSDDVSMIYGSWAKANQACGFRPRHRLEDALRATWLFSMEGFTDASGRVHATGLGMVA